ncbi:MAG: hypothetical protein AAB536_01585, partial [Patescibacteria group bacterium]
ACLPSRIRGFDSLHSLKSNGIAQNFRIPPACAEASAGRKDSDFAGQAQGASSPDFVSAKRKYKIEDP